MTILLMIILLTNVGTIFSPRFLMPFPIASFNDNDQ